MRPPIIETASGIRFNIRAPTPEMVTLEDIATSLANTCRFRGHVSRYYSVAEHSVRVAVLLHERGYTIETQLAGLLHDAHEAYVGDTPTPFKGVLLSDDYEAIVMKIDSMIGFALGVDRIMFHSEPVKTADADMLMIEADQLKATRGVGEHWHLPAQSDPTLWLGMGNEAAQRDFIDTYHSLSSRLWSR